MAGPDGDYGVRYLFIFENMTKLTISTNPFVYKYAYNKKQKQISAENSLIFAFLLARFCANRA